MEQRIGPNSQPLDVAAVSPAHIPGLTTPVSAEPKGDPEPKGDAAAQELTEPDDVEDVKVSEESAEPEESDSAEEAEEARPAPDGPVFEASDRRAKMIADRAGVRLFLDDQECEFRWDEIGAIETEAPRFGKRFTITVHTPDRRWYPIEIEATARERFKEWEEQLDAVLDAYFEDDAESDAEKDAEKDTE
ncbi:hypothetical protein [Streptomyces sp. HUAS ZL42]|uniref:hypothetical protein n=1 Tax=Streptomyces sp. HUAS ZL42 TaxID=3231715 RepID=UPI00345E69F0